MVGLVTEFKGLNTIKCLNVYKMLELLSFFEKEELSSYKKNSNSVIVIENSILSFKVQILRREVKRIEDLILKVSERIEKTNSDSGRINLEIRKKELLEKLEKKHKELSELK